MKAFSRIVNSTAAEVGSKSLACSGSSPATPREMRMWEDVVKDVERLKDCASKEYE